VLHKDAKVELLRRVPLFDRLSKKELREIAGIADELHVPADKTFAVERTSGHEFMIVAEGSAEVRRGGRRINLPGNGDFLGEIALLTGRKRTASVTTREPTRLLVLTERDFRRPGVPGLYARTRAPWEAFTDATALRVSEIRTCRGAADGCRSRTSGRRATTPNRKGMGVQRADHLAHHSAASLLPDCFGPRQRRSRPHPFPCSE
jgi:CRP/FNR family transcriptional regulator, cyclic AMP receptor protein